MSHPVHGPFLATARRYSLCEDDAEEAMSRAYVAAIKQRESIEDPVAWMHTVVKRQALDVRRHRERRATWDPEWIEALQVTAPDDDEHHGDPRLPALRAALGRLREDDRRVLLLFYGQPGSRGDGGAAAHVSRLTGWTPAGVHTRLHRARNRLRAELVPA